MKLANRDGALINHILHIKFLDAYLNYFRGNKKTKK